jgi:hypothetical protein
MGKSLKLLMAAGLALAVAICTPGFRASSGHYVLISDGTADRTATVESGISTVTKMKLIGGQMAPGLTVQGRLLAGMQKQVTPHATIPNLQVAQSGGQTCIYVPNTHTRTVWAFQYPSDVNVGRYSDPKVTNTGYGIGLVAHGTWLFAGYSDNVKYVRYIAT